MYYIGLDIHKKTISYCVKDASGQIHREGKIGSTRYELDSKGGSCLGQLKPARDNFGQLILPRASKCTVLFACAELRRERMDAPGWREGA
jgi:hypothetical protein